MSTQPQGSVPIPAATITLVDVFAKQLEMGAQLLVIHEQLKQLPDHEARIRILEASKSKMIGAAAAVAAVISGGGTWVGIVVTRH